MTLGRTPGAVTPGGIVFPGIPPAGGCTPPAGGCIPNGDGFMPEFPIIGALFSGSPPPPIWLASTACVIASRPVGPGNPLSSDPPIPGIGIDGCDCGMFAIIPGAFIVA
jgi:hypothetical protein